MPIDPDDRELAWQKYVEIGHWERHFNELQVKYRTIVSIWLIASVSGLGFIFTASETVFPLSKLMSAAILLFISAFGIFMVWILDVLVYHRLLDAYFYEGRRLEKTFPWLPQARMRLTYLSETSRSKGILYRTAIFYASTISTKLFLGSLGLFSALIFEPGFRCRALFRELCYRVDTVPIGNPNLSGFVILLFILFGALNFGICRECYYRIIKKSLNKDLKPIEKQP